MMWKILAVSAVFASTAQGTMLTKRNQKVFDDDQRCTSIGVGPKAMIDGSTVTTHNNDCQECDFRITHVPAMDWPKVLPLRSHAPIHPSTHPLRRPSPVTRARCGRSTTSAITTRGTLRTPGARKTSTDPTTPRPRYVSPVFGFYSTGYFTRPYVTLVRPLSDPLSTPHSTSHAPTVPRWTWASTTGRTCSPSASSIRCVAI